MGQGSIIFRKGSPGHVHVLMETSSGDVGPDETDDNARETARHSLLRWQEGTLDRSRNTSARMTRWHMGTDGLVLGR